MDLDRMLGALIGGAVRRPARRSSRRSSNPLSQLGLGGRSGQAQLGRALATLAGVAIEALSNRGSAAPPPPAPAAPRRLPDIGGGAPASSPWSVGPPASEPPASEPAAPAAEAAEPLLMLRAMVAAASADGVLDAAEREAISAQLDTAGLSAEERDFVLADLERPATPEALAAEVRDPMLAAQLYAAAVAITGAPEPAERAWLDRLRAALRLAPHTAAAIEARLAGPPA